MNRRRFIKATVSAAVGGTMATSLVKTILDKARASEGGVRMPTLFVGHGSPMNALANNRFTASLASLGRELPRPKVILAISAHWETRGTKALAVEQPQTIHDFYGFPEALYQINYPAAGSKETAARIVDLLKAHEAESDSTWGLDHGTWTMLHHMYPKADVPVLQLSLNQNLSMRDHYELARELKPLRDQGVLIMGSGNIVHNLRAVDFNEGAKPMDWAVEFDEMIKNALLARDLNQLFAKDVGRHRLWAQALPTLEHYLPLLYVAGASDEIEIPVFPYMEMQMGSLSMRSVKYGGGSNI